MQVFVTRGSDYIGRAAIAVLRRGSHEVTARSSAGSRRTEDAPLAPPSLIAWRLGNEKQVLARAASGGRPVGADDCLLARLVRRPAR